MFACMRRARENVRACVRACVYASRSRHNNPSNSFNSKTGVVISVGLLKGLIFINVVRKLILVCKLMLADEKPKDDKPKVSAFTGKGAKLGKK